MTLSYEAAERLFRLGNFLELLRLTDCSSPSLRSLAAPHQVCVAHALALTGDVARARDLARAIDSTAPSPMVRSQAQGVLGLVSEATGLMSQALEHFQLSVRLAHASKDDEQIAWAQLRLFRHMLYGKSMAALTGMLPEVRRAVIRAASPHATAYLHHCVAVLEGQVGRLDEARRHCGVVDSLLAASPNAWLASGNLLNRVCLALLSCNLDEASAYIDVAKDAAVRSGSARSSAADSNVGHLQLLTGAFERALASFERVSASRQTPRFAALGALDGIARVYLALGRFEDCEHALSRIAAEQISEQSLVHVYHVRWAAVTKARLLMARGLAPEAVQLLEEAQQQSSGAEDAPLAATLHFTSAQALVASGRLADAAARLLAADRLGVTGFRELQGQYYFGAALSLTEESRALRNTLRQRANRLWKQQGIVSLPLEMEASVSKATTTLDHADTGMPNRRTNGASIACVVDSIAGAIDLAYSPRLLGAELIAIINALDCANEARLIEGKAGSDEPPTSASLVTLPLGVDKKKSLVLACSVPTEPSKAIVLADVLRIGRAALALEHAREEERNKAALWPAGAPEAQAGALFISDELQALLATARRVAPTNVPILITGETGTGKEVLARAVHGYSNRAKAAFLPFNCTSMPKDMLDSQLFGHRRGAFTGATDHFPGVIRGAAGGTLFLDEIGDMALEAQPKLLRFLESSEVHPVGETQPVRVDVRVIAATNASLDTLVTDGRFREDLFYRLNIVRLHIPPLRERRVEVPALAHHYLQKCALEYGKGDLRLAEETMEYLLLYRWPGNVRQLANEMRRMAALGEVGAVLMPEHLSPEIAASRRTIPASERVLDPTEVVVRLDQPLAAATQHLERTLLQYALKKCGGRMEETAALLGLSRKGLYLKRQRFGIEPPPEATPATAPTDSSLITEPGDVG